MLARWFGKKEPTGAEALYASLVGWARDPWFYREAAVPDTIDGRFDMVTLMLALALNRLSTGQHEQFGQQLLEHFVADMDESLREMGTGDLGVGKQVRKMAEAMVGRSGAYQAAISHDDLEAALLRNVYRGTRPEAAALTGKVKTLIAALAGKNDAQMLAGRLGPLP